MEFSIQEILKPEIAIGAVLVIGMFVSMRFMPRLMAGVPFIEPKAVYELMDGGKELVILDVRSSEEFEGPLGHVKGDVNLAGMELDKALAAADKKLGSLMNEAIFVVCRTQNRSPRAARLLSKAGFSNVAIIKGGMISRSKQDLPVEK